MMNNKIMKRPDQYREENEPRNYYERKVVPAADIIEGKHDYTVRIDLPGVNKETIDLKIDGDRLRLRASTGLRHGNNAKLRIQETAPVIYEREFFLGNEIDRSKINGEYDHGVLVITLQKNESKKPHEIKIK